MFVCYLVILVSLLFEPIAGKNASPDKQLW